MKMYITFLFFFFAISSAFSQEKVKNYHENGQLMSTGYELDGVKSGEWFFYYENGEPKYSGRIDNNLQEGEWNYYYESGKLHSIVNFLDGKLEGEAKYYFENGKLKRVNSYVAGLTEGEVINYYENGQIDSKVFCIKGIKNKQAIGYHQNGNIRLTCSFIDDKLDGEKKTYFENGQLESTTKYINNLANGPSVANYENGVKESEVNYKDGKLEGEAKYYHENGNLRKTCTYVDQKIVGEKKVYLENGNIGEICSYVDGKIDGEKKIYYENGQLKSATKYVDNVANGPSYTNYENGQLMKKGAFDTNRPNGRWELWYENGQTQTAFIFDRGAMLEIEYLYDNEGKTLDKGTLAKGYGTLNRINTETGEVYTSNMASGYITEDAPEEVRAEDTPEEVVVEDPEPTNDEPVVELPYLTQEELRKNLNLPHLEISGDPSYVVTNSGSSCQWTYKLKNIGYGTLEIKSVEFNSSIFRKSYDKNFLKRNEFATLKVVVDASVINEINQMAISDDVGFMTIKSNTVDLVERVAPPKNCPSLCYFDYYFKDYIKSDKDERFPPAYQLTSILEENGQLALSKIKKSTDDSYVSPETSELKFQKEGEHASVKVARDKRVHHYLTFQKFGGNRHLIQNIKPESPATPASNRTTCLSWLNTNVDFHSSNKYGDSKVAFTRFASKWSYDYCFAEDFTATKPRRLEETQYAFISQEIGSYDLSYEYEKAYKGYVVKLQMYAKRGEENFFRTVRCEGQNGDCGSADYLRSQHNDISVHIAPSASSAAAYIEEFKKAFDGAFGLK